jgi:predicted membrane channel-forming protein YqfA (hemolysin III family)
VSDIENEPTGPYVRWRTENPAEAGDHPFRSMYRRLARDSSPLDAKETLVNRIVYIVGAVVIIIALLSFFGLR